jgi:hypothetical protein
MTFPFTLVNGQIHERIPLGFSPIITTFEKVIKIYVAKADGN